ncbi:MAG TPA: hypothetical protein VFM18_23630 [Methanosarcina sp.]|nr:hypothetical protein [Methanosarcina sp.]
MLYAIRKDGLGWRAINKSSDASLSEYVSDTVPAPVVPTSVSQVTMRQARLSLLQAGKLRAVEDAIDALPEPDRTKALIEWDYSTTVERTSPLVKTLAPILGINDAALDDLFNTASTL